MHIRVKERRLTDGSKVTDLILGDTSECSGQITLAAVGSQDDAFDTAHRIKQVIEFGTTDTCTISTNPLQG